MARMHRGNVILNVEDFEVQHYLSLGYIYEDEGGGVIEEPIPTDFNALRSGYAEYKQRVEELEKQVAVLTARLELAEKPKTQRKTQQ